MLGELVSSFKSKSSLELESFLETEQFNNINL